MHAANHGHRWIADISPDKKAWRAARTSVLTTMREWDDDDPDLPDGVMWIDSDMLPPTDGITRLLSHGHEFITGLYFHRQAPHHPTFGPLTPEGSVQWALKYEEGVGTIGGCGFGFVYTSTRILKAINRYAFLDPKWGEDISFCNYVKDEKLAELHIDTSIVVGHLADPTFIGPEDYDEKEAVITLMRAKHEMDKFKHNG
jgi:hypothetical protein